MPDGRVLCVGYQNHYFDPRADSAAGMWTIGPAMINPRKYFTLTAMKNGDLLAVGGGGLYHDRFTSERYFVSSSDTVLHPTRLAVAAVFPATVVVNTPFTVVVEARDENGLPQNVSAATSVQLSLAAGTGELKAGVTGTIAAGENRIMLSGVIYSAAESAVRLRVSSVSGMKLLTDSSSPFTVYSALPPSQPTMLAADPGNRIVTLSWMKNPEPNIKRYYVYRGASAGTLSLVDSTACTSDSLFTVRGLLNGSTYFFSIAAKDSNDLYSTHSSIVTATPSLFSERVLTGVSPLENGSASWGDFNGDGLPDVITTGQVDGILFSRIYANTGHDTFKNVFAPLDTVRNGHTEWSDFNNDNLLDVLFVGFNRPPTFPGMTEVYMNSGNNYFAASGSPFDAIGNSCASGDYDNDGKNDLRRCPKSC